MGVIMSGWWVKGIGVGPSPCPHAEGASPCPQEEGAEGSVWGVVAHSAECRRSNHCEGVR